MAAAVVWISEMVSFFGRRVADRWMRALQRALARVCGPRPDAAARARARLPRLSREWLRRQAQEASKYETA